MKRSLMTALVVCLLGGAAVPVAAQEPSSERVGLGGRVEMPEFGFALTYPDDWAWAQLTELDQDALVELLSAVTDPDYAEGYRPLLAELDESFPITGSPYVAGEDDGSYCGVGVVPTDLALEEAVANVVDYYGSDEDTFPGGATTADVTLPVGEAARIDYLQMEPGWTVPWQQTQYALTNGSVLYYVGCSGVEAPDDGWLSLAETFEFLPDDETSSTEVAQGSQLPVSIGERVEVSGSGYVMAAPEGWVTVLPSAEDADRIIDTLRDVDPELATMTENALASGIDFSLLMFAAYDTDRGFRPNCNVIDYASEGRPLEMLVADDVAAFGEMGDRLAIGPEATTLELAAGEVARLDYGLQYPEFDTVHAAYYFSRGETIHLLTCTDVERSEDDWLSVADTFEFLAPE